MLQPKSKKKLKKSKRMHNDNKISRVAAHRINSAIMKKLCSWDEGKPLLRLREPERELISWAISNVLKQFYKMDSNSNMKVVYIAHPISDNPIGNLESIRDIVRNINLTMPDVVPFVPYYADCVSLNEHDELERSRGIANDKEIISRGFIDECWCFGDFISKGMMAEIELFTALEVPVKYKSLKLQKL
jgi:hypothetical protein